MSSTRARFYRVIINEEAFKSLNLVMQTLNDDVYECEIQKGDIVNYLLCNYSRFLDESEFKRLKNLHFNEKAALAKLMKKELSDDLKKAIRDHYGLNDKSRKINKLNSEHEDTNNIEKEKR